MLATDNYYAVRRSANLSECQDNPVAMMASAPDPANMFRTTGIRQGL
jgi:hypothetical protein